MYDACVDKDSASTRPRGMLTVRKTAGEHATAGKHHADKGSKATAQPN